MRQVAAAALLYFAIVFGVGVVLGTIRVPWLEPRLGPTLAVLLEVPILLAAMIAAARWVPRKLGLETAIAGMASMGISALALVLAADFTLGLWLRGLTPTEQLRYLGTPAGLLYSISLVLFGAMPALVNRRGARTA